MPCNTGLSQGHGVNSGKNTGNSIFIPLIVQVIPCCIMRILCPNRSIFIPKCFRYYETSYYMYANADMLFDEGLIKTLEYLKFFPQRLDKMMMVGVRTNINASLITNVYK